MGAFRSNAPAPVTRSDKHSVVRRSIGLEDGSGRQEVGTGLFADSELYISSSSWQIHGRETYAARVCPYVFERLWLHVHRRATRRTIGARVCWHTAELRPHCHLPAQAFHLVAEGLALTGGCTFNMKLSFVLASLTALCCAPIPASADMVNRWSFNNA